MTLAEISLRRPVLATVACLMIVVVGAASLLGMSVRELPDIDTAEITVSVDYTGAAPEVIDSQVTSLIEGSIAGITGLRSISSESDRGSSRSVLIFDSSRDIDLAANDVRSAVDAIVEDLPEEASAPQIEKNDSQGDPVMRLSLASTAMSAIELSDYANRFVVDRLARLDGVASVQINGERAPAMRIWLDVARMAAHSITVEDVTAALQGNNIELPAGEIQTPGRQIQVLARTRLGQREEFEAMVLRTDAGHPILLSDVARIEEGTENDETLFRSNGLQTIGLAVLAQAQANTIAISQAVQAEFEVIRQTLPEGTTLEVGSDEAVFIERSIEQVLHVLVEALVLVMLVIVIFLGSLRAALVPAITIPVSLLGAVAGMAIMGFSVNVLTLFAIILAIGLVVDDAIIVLENIQRRVSLGEEPLKASLLGTAQVNFAVIATTAVLIAVFVPISFMEGEVGRLFAEFGIVLAIAVAVSSFVALSVCPMLAARVVGSKGSQGRFVRLVDRCLEGLNRVYRTLLTAALGRPIVVMGTCVFLAAAAVAVYERLPQELAPAEDRGSISISILAPQGSNLEVTNAVTREVEAIVEPLREEGLVNNYTSLVGRWGELHRAVLFVRLSEWSRRDATQAEILSRIRPQLERIGGAQIRASGQGGLSGGGGGITAIVGGPDMASAVEWSAEVAEAMENHPAFEGVEVGYNPNQPGLDVEIDRERARSLGVDAAAVSQTLQVLFASRSLTEYTDRSRQYPVLLRAAPDDRNNAADLLDVGVRAASGELVPLGGFVSIAPEAGAPTLLRYDRMPSVEVDADLAEGADMGEAVAFLQETVGDLPAGATLAFDGAARDFVETSGGMGLVFGLALVIVFLVLAAQFESFLDPIVILLTVPLAAVGAIFSLWITDQSINIFSQVGLLLLIGLVAKNGILIVEFANQLRAEGKDLREAVAEAATLRLRPILMTTIATIVGAIPLVLASGAGAESRISIGIVIAGGFSFASLLTLFLTPVLYEAIGAWKGREGQASRRLDEALSAG